MNLANKITILRILMVPIFIVTLYLDINNNHIYAAIIFGIAAITDTLDGYIARSRNLITDFGKFMDPLADKLLVTAALIILVELGKIPGWVVILILTREFTITGFRVLAAAEGITIAASSWGKIKTVTQITAIILILINNFPFNKLDIPVDMILLYLSLGFTIISGYDYINKNINKLNLDSK